MRQLDAMMPIALCLTMALIGAGAKAAEENRLDWMPPQLDERGLNSQNLGGEQIIPEIMITKTPKPTSDMSKYAKVYEIELEKFNISSNGTNADETSKGINTALQYAKTVGANRIVFPTGTYLISETEPIVFNHKDTIVDLNGSTLQMRTNGQPRYRIAHILEGSENFRLMNGTLRGDRDTHDMTTIKSSHEGCGLLTFYSGRNLEVDHITFTKAVSTAVSTVSSGSRNREELLRRIKASVYLDNLEQGAFSAQGERVASTGKMRTIEPYDTTQCKGEFEFGCGGIGYQGYPFIKGRVYRVVFYDMDMKFLEMKKVLQYKKVTVPDHAAFMHLEFNQPEVTGKPKDTVGRITNFDPPVDVHFHHNIMVDNRNLGLGYCGGQRWLIEDCVFEKNGPDIVGWGIDFEDGWELMQDVVLRNNLFKDNLKGDIVVCAGSELLFDGNTFTGSLLFHGRPHNYIVRNNTFTGGSVTYTTRTGIAKIHNNIYKDCSISIVYDTKAVADGLYRKAGQNVATPPLVLEHETLTHVSKVTGTYFNFQNAALNSTRFIVGQETRMAAFDNCQFNDVALEYEADGPEVTVTHKNCKGEPREEGPGLSRKKASAVTTEASPVGADAQANGATAAR